MFIRLTFVLLATLLIAACGNDYVPVPEPNQVPASSAPTLPTASAPVSSPTPVSTKPWQLVHSQGMMNFVHIEPAQWKDEDQYRLAIAEICAGKTICFVTFWKERSLVPTSLPMSDAQAAGQVAQWQFNGNTGHRQLLWSCEIVNDPSQCFTPE